jgi:hypothetical protein
MKKTITISIDFAIYERLKREDNYSGLVNQLINDYYAMDSLKTKLEELPIEKLQEKLQISKRKKELEAELKKLEDEYEYG